jgi:hypothetical protein
MSMMTRAGRAPAFQAFSRARARAARNASTNAGSAAIASMTRKAVAFEATSPNNGSWSRTARRSARQSPPSASITARSRTTRPGSWRPRRSRIPASPRDSAAVSPTRSAASATSAAPAWLTSPSPSGVTSTVNRRSSRVGVGGEPRCLACARSSARPRPPNRTCPFPSIRLSAGHALVASGASGAGRGRGERWLGGPRRCPR